MNVYFNIGVVISGIIFLLVLMRKINRTKHEKKSGNKTNASYTINSFREQLRESVFDRSFVSETNTMLYFNDELAFPVDITISIPDKKAINVITKKGLVNYLIKEDHEVWLLRQDSQSIEVYNSGTLDGTYKITELLDILKRDKKEDISSL